jgi:hypothetical protein
MERRTVAGWVHYLEAPDAQLTLSEFMALCLLHTRENVKDTRLGTQHLEGMIGTLDAFLAGTNPTVYGALANARAAPANGAAAPAALAPEGDRP